MEWAIFTYVETHAVSCSHKVKTAFHGILLETILHYCCKSSYSLNMFNNHQIEPGYCMINSSTFFFWGLESGLVFLSFLTHFS